jgi:RNA polymerase sigma factor (sigma-70 family)
VPTDHDLVKACIKGDQQAFAEIVDRYKRLIYSIVYNLVKNKYDASDISQEVFLRIYKALDRYNPEYKFSTWAARITTNYCYDLLRKKRVEIADVDDIERYSGEEESPETIYLRNEKKIRIQMALDSLPDKYKIPIVLYHQKGMSYKEITEILKEPMSIIKNRIYRARIMLKDMIIKDREEGVL